MLSFPCVRSRVRVVDLASNCAFSAYKKGMVSATVHCHERGTAHGASVGLPSSMSLASVRSLCASKLFKSQHRPRANRDAPVRARWIGCLCNSHNTERHNGHASNPVPTSSFFWAVWFGHSDPLYAPPLGFSCITGSHHPYQTSGTVWFDVVWCGAARTWPKQAGGRGGRAGSWNRGAPAPAARVRIRIRAVAAGICLYTVLWQVLLPAVLPLVTLTRGGPESYSLGLDCICTCTRHERHNTQHTPGTQ